MDAVGCRSGAPGRDGVGCRPAAPSRCCPGPRPPAPPPWAPLSPPGPGCGGGSGQHLRNLGRAVGAKVNDLLRRKEPGGPGATEVNAPTGAQPARAEDTVSEKEDEQGLAAPEAFPRLEPPPAAPRKRVSRALKTPQDMLISSQPVLSGLDGDLELSPGRPPDPPPAPADGPDRDPAVPNGDVPDLLHQDGQDAPPAAGDPRRDSLGAPGSPRARTPSLDPEAPHPDLLAFE
ncbi:uncharacterized protein C1orf226 homolog [Sorex fumeus]|uniref:uncharacterized protein C1orf226 homolog n=1 Tax=Sorex fumeus TaxID=62283 RepID=UPI0024AD8365|nr:uncharacterized protein C1orf226 homolog [Sorex fumeus]